MTSDSKHQQLLEAAWRAREQACCTYSGFAVGAALETVEGKTYDGCNVESSSYGLSCCAERVALFKALAAGERTFSRIAVVTDAGTICPPCGACRQLLSDYAPGIEVIMGNRDGSNVLQLAELYPHGFDASFLDAR